MKLKYLGTGAAEGIPALFCDCDICTRSRAAGGRNLRSRSQAIIDGKLLLDFPPDTYMHVLYQGLNLMPVRNCLITHGHPDHLYALDFAMRKEGFSYYRNMEKPPLNIYCSGKTAETVMRGISVERIPEDVAKLNTIRAFEPFQADEYSVTAFSADHAKELEPLIYAVSDGEKTLLYGHDTGYFPETTWEALARLKPRFDFVSLDCTGPLADYYNNHMNMETCAKVRDRLKEIGCADEDTKFCLHHFSHNGFATYDDLLELTRETGFMVSYDGMEIEI